ncbi:hypothetical protein M6B38_105380 [Iris pallida]|uniref:Uncharacterized protein n=1 Tax=Iris pallida TaxID=29817 RepID=A0AAX6ERE3_IRIPA|nr:hypothetical protein M6B38_105380 [Iris pallida]
MSSCSSTVHRGSTTVHGSSFQPCASVLRRWDFVLFGVPRRRVTVSFQ